VSSLFVKCFSYRSFTAAPSGFIMNASRSFHVIGTKRGHSFPPIAFNTCAVNFPRLVLWIAADRTE
jgi:hypothetical protein